MILPDMADRVRWLSRRLNNGELSGYRAGHRDNTDRLRCDPLPLLLHHVLQCPWPSKCQAARRCTGEDETMG